MRDRVDIRNFIIKKNILDLLERQRAAELVMEDVYKVVQARSRCWNGQSGTEE